MNSLGERLRAIAEHQTSATRRFKELELATDIASETWRTFWGRNARPSADMVEAVAQRWPQYAFWLATGITDPVFGHIAPPTSPKRFPVIRGVEQETATREFRYLIDRLKSEPTADDEAQRRAQELEDAGLEAMKRLVTPAAHVSYEKAMRGFGEPGRYDLYLLALDSDYSEISSARHDSESFAQQQQAWGWFRNIATANKVDKHFRWFSSVLRKLFGANIDNQKD